MMFALLDRKDAATRVDWLAVNAWTGDIGTLGDAQPCGIPVCSDGKTKFAGTLAERCGDTPNSMPYGPDAAEMSFGMSRPVIWQYQT